MEPAAWFLSLPNFFLDAYPGVIVLLLSVLVLLRFNRKKSRLLKKREFPWSLSRVRRVHDWFTEVLESKGGTVVFKGPFFWRLHTLLTCDPENLHYMSSRAHFANFPKGGDHVELFDIFGNGILNADGASWQRQRKWTHRLLRGKGFRLNLARTSREKVERGLLPLMDQMAEKRQAFDLQAVFQRYAFDVSFLLICGVDPGALHPSLPVIPLIKAMDDASEVIVLRHAMPRFLFKLQRWLRVGKEKTMARAWDTVDHTFHTLIASRRRELETTTDVNRECHDLLSSYMGQPTDDPELERFRTDEKFLRDITLNMMAAGRNTTSSALTWFFWELSQNPQVEAKILHELRTGTKADAETVKIYTAEEVSGLVYFNAALLECLRLYPSVPLLLKGAVSPDTLPSGQRVEPGMRIVVSLYALGRRANIWGSDCREFKPERWLTEEGKLRDDLLHNFLPFTAGPRSCLGKDMALTQMKVVAATLVHNFHVRVEEGQKATPATSVSLDVKNGLTVKVARRIQ